MLDFAGDNGVLLILLSLEGDETTKQKYTVVGVCEERCADLDLILYDESETVRTAIGYVVTPAERHRAGEAKHRFSPSLSMGCLMRPLGAWHPLRHGGDIFLGRHNPPG